MGNINCKLTSIIWGLNFKKNSNKEEKSLFRWDIIKNGTGQEKNYLKSSLIIHCRIITI